jgi:hypothetical protein
MEPISVPAALMASIDLDTQIKGERNVCAN